MTIAEINDSLREQLPWIPKPHKFVMSTAVAVLPPRCLSEVLVKIRAFNSFNSSNDPYGERDFISVTHADDTYFLKIDYYDKNLEYFYQGNDGVRVFTLMFSHEY
jgi:hypothetical protein